MIKVSQLPDNPKTGVMLLCPAGLEEYSANPDDYWHLPPDYIIRCEHHGVELILVHKQTTWETISPAEANHVEDPKSHTSADRDSKTD